MPSDLELARATSSVDAESIAALLRTPNERAVRAKLLPIFAADQVFAKTSRPFKNHAQNMLYALEMSKRILELRDTHKWTHEEWKAALDLQNDSLPITLHEGAFATVIEAQGTDAQRDFWIPKCRSYQVIGCYAQTELAHGSNVQGLETIAKFDPATDEYIVSSPRRESTKWWIGGMGVLANHALVQAILELPSGRKGPHLFIVPIRNQTTHRPLPNVTVGDIGPKAYGGFCYMDNGYLHLSSVRIPRANMLQRFASVSADGSYTPAKHDKLSYGSMVALRAGIPINSGWNLARAVTIAIRYCINRRQFSPSKTEVESQVLTYASTKMRLYPLLARSYAYIFAGRSLWALYQQFLESLTKDGDISMLPEIHALSTALKVKATWDCVSGLEEARKCMGGHGFSHMSGVGSLFAAQAPSQTYEGDNYVISQQIARALVKALGFLKQMPDAPLPDSFAYLRLAVNGLRIAKDDDLHMLHARTAGLVAELAKEVATNPEKGWTDHSWTAARVAAAHADVFVCSSLPETPLTKLHILSTLVAALPELLETGVVTSPQSAKELRRRQGAEVEGLSIGDVVGLTDAFEFDDWELPGVVGGKEGMVYGKMLKTVEEWDVNKGEMGEEIRRMALEITGKGRRSKL